MSSASCRRKGCGKELRKIGDGSRRLTGGPLSGREAEADGRSGNVGRGDGGELKSGGKQEEGHVIRGLGDGLSRERREEMIREIEERCGKKESVKCSVLPPPPRRRRRKKG